jgi:AraC-like DNA-binding protein
LSFSEVTGRGKLHSPAHVPTPVQNVNIFLGRVIILNTNALPQKTKCRKNKNNIYLGASMITQQIILPNASLSDFVESFWMLQNLSEREHQIIVLPDGRFDIIFMSVDDNFSATLKGLDTEPQQTAIPPNATLFAVSFKLLAIEYLLDVDVHLLLNEGLRLPDGYWEIQTHDLENFDAFYSKASAKLKTFVKPDIDDRKRELFNLIYKSNGTLTVQELSDKVFWSSRQINRYFNQTFGIPLKAYCNIFRFKSSLEHIKKGNLFPELNFADQNHFIREVKKMSGVTPKELSRNHNDRFILLSALG